MDEIQPKTLMNRTLDLIGVDRILIYGLLLVLMMLVTGGFYIAIHAEVNAKAESFVLPFFKDIAVFIVGALTGILVPKSNKP